MIQSRLAYLFNAYFNKTATLQERDELMDLLAHAENDAELKTLLSETWQRFNSQSQVFTDTRGDEMLAGILRKAAADRAVPVVAMHRRSFGWRSMAAAAVILCFIAAGSYFWLRAGQDTPPIARAGNHKTGAAPVKTNNGPIVPGGNRAVLTLADGDSIVLDSSRQGTLTKQGNTKIVRLNTATLAYNTGNEKSRETVYNTLTTPPGGQYQVILADGTSVWLNAASSIHFPAIFSGNERRVTLTGEAYFEVAKDAVRPFKITVKDMEVEVLGTHFNIMAYDDENSMNTTLLEGSVKVSRGSSNKLLAPGQESRIGRTGDIKLMQADVEEVMAWKNGLFQFNAYNIEKVMKQISRWYDVEIVYEGDIPTGHFSGLVSRQNDIVRLLKIMQAGGVRCKIVGRKVIVLG